MSFRFVALALVGALTFGTLPARAQQPTGPSAQNAATPTQRLEVLRSRLDTMRRTLNGAVAGLNARDSGGGEADKSAEDARARLRGLEKEVGSLSNDVSDFRSKVDRGDKFDPSEIEGLETATADLNERVNAGMLATASARRDAGGAASTATVAAGDKKKKKKDDRGFFGKLLGRGGDEKYAELVGGVAPGRDRELFEVATKEARDKNFEVARSLYGVIISTYPESAYLPLSKLAIADTFYLEGTTSALIQAAQAYQDWLTFFPTDPLSDEVMLKIAEVEMRKIGLPDRDVSSARKAEQRIKVMMQQFPETSLKTDAEVRLREVQEVLAAHDMIVGNQYYARYFRQVASNPKGAQSRYLDIVKKYPYFSYLDEVLFKLGQTYLEEEEPDEAVKYFQQLVRFYPHSKYAEDAKEKLLAIGAAVPDPDPEALKIPPAERPGKVEQLMIALRGSTPKTVNKDGVIIARADEANDLIQQAIANGGQLPHTASSAPTPRIAPARRVVAPLPPANTARPAGGTTGASGNSGGTAAPVQQQPTQTAAPAAVSGTATKP